MARPLRHNRKALDYAHLSSAGHLATPTRKTTVAKNFVKNYALKRDKALGCKLRAADRTDIVDIKQTGGGIVILCQLGYYESLRHALLDRDGYLSAPASR